jgi:hypothetical protein
MNRVLLNPSVRKQLNGLNEPLEICDEGGQTLGHFLPGDLFREWLVAWSRAHLTDAELESRRREMGGSSLAEIWQRLGNA